jgi:hypothetical protein
VFFGNDDRTWARFRSGALMISRLAQNTQVYLALLPPCLFFVDWPSRKWTSRWRHACSCRLAHSVGVSIAGGVLRKSDYPLGGLRTAGAEGRGEKLLEDLHATPASIPHHGNTLSRLPRWTGSEESVVQEGGLKGTKVVEAVISERSTPRDSAKERLALRSYLTQMAPTFPDPDLWRACALKLRKERLSCSAHPSSNNGATPSSI